MFHKVILQTQQGNTRFANCLNDIFAITLNYCCSKSHFTIFQLDYILKLYPSQDKYSTSYLHTLIFFFYNFMFTEGLDVLFQNDRRFISLCQNLCVF